MALKLNGVILSAEPETFEYKSKKTGNQEKMTRLTVVLQGEFGVICGNAFNPKCDLATLKAGSKVSVEVNEYKVEDGIQKAVFRL